MNKIKKTVSRAMGYGKKTASKASDYAAKHRYIIRSKLKKQYKFTKEQLDEVFRIWKSDMEWLNQKIKDAKRSNEEAFAYTEMGKETWSTIYDVLIRWK